MLPLLPILLTLSTIFLIVVFTSIYQTTIYDSNGGRGSRKRKLFEDVQELSTVEEEDSEVDNSSHSDGSETVVDMLHRSIINSKVDSSKDLSRNCACADVCEQVLNEDDKQMNDSGEEGENCECRPAGSLEIETTSGITLMNNSSTSTTDSESSVFKNHVKDCSEHTYDSNSPKIFIALRKEPEYKSFIPSS